MSEAKGYLHIYSTTLLHTYISYLHIYSTTLLHTDNGLQEVRGYGQGSLSCMALGTVSVPSGRARWSALG